MFDFVVEIYASLHHRQQHEMRNENKFNTIIVVRNVRLCVWTAKSVQRPINK